MFAYTQVGGEVGHDRAGQTGISARRRHATLAREIRNAGAAIIVLPPESNKLRGHVAESSRGVPSLELVTRIFCEIRCAGKCCGAIYGWKQNEVTSGVDHHATAKSYGEAISIEPETVVEHAAQEILFGQALGIAKAGDPAAAFTSRVDGHRKADLSKKRSGWS